MARIPSPAGMTAASLPLGRDGHDGRTVPQPSTPVDGRDLWPRPGSLNTSLRYTMDYDLWLRMVPQAQEVRYSSQLLACERIHENQMSLAAARAGQYEPVNCEKAYAALHAARGRASPRPLAAEELPPALAHGPPPGQIPRLVDLWFPPRRPPRRLRSQLPPLVRNKDRGHRSNECCSYHRLGRTDWF